jgi:hypothetical protein
MDTCNSYTNLVFAPQPYVVPWFVESSRLLVCDCLLDTEH